MFAGISSVDSFPNAIKPPTSQSHHSANAKSTNNLTPRKQSTPAPETIAIVEPTFDVVVNNEQCISEPVLTPTELLSASIEKVVKEQSQLVPETSEVSSASEAQAKLTQSLSSVLRSSQTELTMKDINLNNKTTGQIYFYTLSTFYYYYTLSLCLLELIMNMIIYCAL